MSDGGPPITGPAFGSKTKHMKPIIVDLTYTFNGQPYKPVTARVEFAYHDDIWESLRKIDARYISHTVVDDGGRDRNRRITVGEMIALLQELPDKDAIFTVEVGQFNKLNGWDLYPRVDDWHPMTLDKQNMTVSRRKGATIRVKLPGEAYVAKWPKENWIDSAS